MRYGRKGFDFGDFEITKREILASISIIAVMILFGILISSKISEHQMDKNEIYNKAVKIESQEMFQYGMDINVGNAFVYGDLKAVDTVTCPEIGGEYMYVEKVKERYTMHTRTVTHTDCKGHSYTTTETYWTYQNTGGTGGKELSQYQIDMLVRLGVDIVLCLDKDVKKEELEELAERFPDGVPLYYMFDEDNILDEKESPADDPIKWKHLVENNIYRLR